MEMFMYLYTPDFDPFSSPLYLRVQVSDLSSVAELLQFD